MNISVKVKFRPSSHPDGEGAVCYQVIHERKTRQFVTDYRLLPSEWDEKRNTVRLKADTPHNAYVLSLRQDIRSDVERIMHIARRMDAENTDFSVQDIIDEFQRYATDYTLFNYTERIIARLKKDDKIRTSETYHAALMSFRKFRDNRDLPLDRITPDLMEDYQAWLPYPWCGAQHRVIFTHASYAPSTTAPCRTRSSRTATPSAASTPAWTRQ